MSKSISGAVSWFMAARLGPDLSEGPRQADDPRAVIDAIDFKSMTQAQRDRVRAFLTEDGEGSGEIADEAPPEDIRRSSGEVPPKRRRKPRADAMLVVLGARLGEKTPSKKRVVPPVRPIVVTKGERDKIAQLMADMDRLSAPKSE